MAPNPFDYFAIQNTLARYCIALDTKNFDLLADIFTPDVTAKFPVFDKEINDLATLREALVEGIGDATTSHGITTQTIAVSEDGKTAEAVTYFTGTHIGTAGAHAGVQFTAYGKYLDSLVCIEGKGALPGSTGQWLVRKRELVLIARTGDEGIMFGGKGPPSDY